MNGERNAATIIAIVVIAAVITGGCVGEADDVNDAGQVMEAATMEAGRPDSGNADSGGADPADDAGSSRGDSPCYEYLSLRGNDEWSCCRGEEECLTMRCDVEEAGEICMLRCEGEFSRVPLDGSGPWKAVANCVDQFEIIDTREGSDRYLCDRV